MQNNFVCGTHAEIFSMSLCIGKPVFVAVKSNKYYWAKYVCKRKDQMISLSCTPHLELPLGLNHMEIGHLNNNHYEVILTTDKSLPRIPPFAGDVIVSSSVNLCG